MLVLGKCNIRVVIQPGPSSGVQPLVVLDHATHKPAACGLHDYVWWLPDPMFLAVAAVHGYYYKRKPMATKVPVFPLLYYDIYRVCW